MASIRKLANGTFQATVFLGRDANGKHIRDYLTRDTEKEAKSAARKMEEAYENNKLLNVSNMKFSVWVEKYLEIKKPPEPENGIFVEIKKPILSPTSYRYYNHCCHHHLIPCFGKYKVNQINHVHIEQYISDKLKSGLSGSTVKKHISILSGILGMALKRLNPCLDVNPPEVDSEPGYVPTHEDYELLLNAVSNLWDVIPILLAGWCGLREGEIFCLKPNDRRIYIKNDGEKIYKIQVDENRALSEKGYVEKKPKSKKGKREIIIPEYIMNLLDSRIDELKIADDEYIFTMRPDSYGKRFADIISYHNLMLMDKPTGKKASFNKNSLPRTLKIQDKPIPRFTFHALRHYHATTLYENDFPDQYAADRMGHDIIVLKRIYQRLQLDKKDACDNKVIELYKKKKTS